MAQQDYRDAQRDFSQGDVFGGLRELSEARQHTADGFSHLNGGAAAGSNRRSRRFPQRPQAGGTRLAARSTPVRSVGQNFSACDFL